MPKEIPATTLIFDSIVDVTRKKQPCRGGKASLWVQCFSPHPKPAPPQSTRRRCSCAGSRGLLAATFPPDLGKVIPLSALRRPPASPAALSRGALPLGCSQRERWVEQGDSSEERPLHHPGRRCWMRSPLLTTGSGLCTAVERRQLCRNKLYWERTSLFTCSRKHTALSTNTWVRLVPALQGRSGGDLRHEGGLVPPYPFPTLSPGESLGHRVSGIEKAVLLSSLPGKHKPFCTRPALPSPPAGLAEGFFLSLTYIHKHFQLGFAWVFQILLRAVVLALAAAPGDAPLGEVLGPLPVRVVLHPAAVQLEGEARLGSTVTPGYSPPSPTTTPRLSRNCPHLTQHLLPNSKAHGAKGPPAPRGG